MLADVTDTEGEASRRAARATNKLGMPSRVAAFALGVAGLGAGAVAVFVTHLEAGPVALLAVGLIFMIVGLAGTLPTRLKVGDNEAAWEIERQAVETFVERVAEVTPVANQREFLGALGDLAEDAPEVAARGISAFAYEQQLRAELEEVVRELEHSFPDGQPVNFMTTATADGQMVDAIILGPAGRRVAVEAKLSAQRLAPSWIDLMHQSFLRKSRASGDFAALLFVTRKPLTRALAERLKEYPEIRHVLYRGPEDREALKRALREVLAG
jgi:hypothetical protein